MTDHDSDLFLGLDFGTDSVRALLVDGRGHIAATAVEPYEHGQMTAGSAAAAAIFVDPLPPASALQDPSDWLASAEVAVKAATAGAGVARRVSGIGTDFTSCTMLPTLTDGTPLVNGIASCRRRPHAWPKLWKHHGAASQAARMTTLAARRGEPWLDRYGGVIGLEWFFPKILEVIKEDPEVAAATEVWLEAGDWVVWQLTGAASAGGGSGVDSLVRSTCQAGYKALWSRDGGFPPPEYLRACDSSLTEAARTKLPGRMLAPGQMAGRLSPAAAERLGLPAGTPISTAVIDAHAGVPGAGVARPGELVLVLGTSGCHMVMAERYLHIPGVAGVVADGILPGYFGYETGQAAVGDAFDWVRRLCGERGHEGLEARALSVAPGADGLHVVDWFNGCRTPLMDGGLTGAILGAGLHHTPAHLYRAALEASACGLRWIVETLRGGGVPIERIVATGGLPHGNRLFITILASVLGEPVEAHAAAHGPALGAAILGALSAGRFEDAEEAVSAMAGPASALPPNTIVAPDPARITAYDEIYSRYRRSADLLAAGDRSSA